MQNSTPWPNLIAIVLAAGKGRRFGLPKADALYRGKSFLDNILDTLKASGIEDVFIAQDPSTPDMLASLRLAVSELKHKNPSAYIVFPVDHPTVAASTVRELATAHKGSPGSIIRPCFGSRRGHPIIIPAVLDIFCYQGSDGLSGIIRASVLPKIDLNVDDPAILENINYAHQLASASTIE